MFLFLTSLVYAETAYYDFRTGLCAGASAQCPIFGIKADLALPHVGASFTLNPEPQFFTIGVTAKIYPSFSENKEMLISRSYFYTGVVLTDYREGGSIEIGFGTDFHLFRHFIIQTSIGGGYLYGIYWPALPVPTVSLSLMYSF